VVPKKLAFVQKWMVMPAVYRDVETSTTGGLREVPPINYLYIRLITSAPTVISGLVFANGARKLRAQETLLEIHRAALSLVSGKRGLIQDRILGKYNDYAVRAVLSSPPLAKAEKPGEQEVPFGSLGVPLYLYINLFQPFIVRALTEQFRFFTEGQERVLISGPKEEPVYFELPADAKAAIGPDLFKKWIAKFMRSQESRLEPVTVTGRGKEIRIPIFDRWLGRPTTLLDLFYVAAERVNADKDVMFTRYPVEDFRACHFAKASILTVERTKTVEINGRQFRHYPDVAEPVRWVDSCRLNNSYAKAMGADYDGDTHRIVGLFTQEANEEAERLIRRPTNFCDGQGYFGRPIGNEGILTLYSMTR
jgi:hypothetical protein